MISITLIGPGGAGKSTVGPRLAARLGVAFIDLDRRFADRCGDISTYIQQCGYEAYARQNVETYCALSDDSPARVYALSSGFMTYAREVHPEYARIRAKIENRSTTFVLIPSLNREQCVKETVRRQLARPFTRTAAEEEAVIRERFSIYMAVSVPKIETMRPVTAVVEDLVNRAARSAMSAWSRRKAPGITGAV